MTHVYILIDNGSPVAFFDDAFRAQQAFHASSDVAHAFGAGETILMCYDLQKDGSLIPLMEMGRK